MKPEEKQELATLYATDRLPLEHKPIVFRLILEDAEFKAMLREEIQWASRMKGCRVSMNPSRKAASLANIRARLAKEDKDEREMIVRKACEETLRLLLPGVVFPYVRPIIES